MPEERGAGWKDYPARVSDVVEVSLQLCSIHSDLSREAVANYTRAWTYEPDLIVACR
jgi:hypothetical protein